MFRLLGKDLLLFIHDMTMPKNYYPMKFFSAISIKSLILDKSEGDLQLGGHTTDLHDCRGACTCLRINYPAYLSFTFPLALCQIVSLLMYPRLSCNSSLITCCQSCLSPTYLPRRTPRERQKPSVPDPCLPVLVAVWRLSTRPRILVS